MLELGQTIEFSYSLKRIERSEEFTSPHGRKQYRVIREWSERPNPVRRGIVVGVRTLSNGETEYVPEEGTTYFPRKYFKAYLVSFDMRRNPVLVLEEHLKVV